MTARVILVTGPSGAGRSTAINALEDLGFEAIDNIPLSLIDRLLAAEDDAPPRPLALGLDVRNRDFSTRALMTLVDRLDRDPGIQAELVYLDARPDILRRRYSETRRRHPLAPTDTPEAGIAREVELLAAIRARAETLIDTSEMTPHDLRAEVSRLLAPDGGVGIAISVQSFSYKRGLPHGADIVFDMRFLRNPHWEPALRDLDGRDAAVAKYVASDTRFTIAIERLVELVLELLPAYLEEGKTHLTIAFGCTGGQHRSVAVAEAMAERLGTAGWYASLRHREMERRAVGAGRPAKEQSP